MGNALVIAEAAGGGTIKFHCGGPATIQVTATLVIPDNITIDGGATITLVGANVVVAFVGSNPTVALKGLVISGQPRSSNCPGGVLNEGTLTVHDTTFADNVVDFFGNMFIGTLTNFGALTVNNSTFIRNRGLSTAG